MAVKIGHASLDERGKISGGAAGDQTGKEVCMRDWYDKGWNVCLRPKTKEIAEQSAQACEKGCKNNDIGYDQGNRNSLHREAKKVNHNLSKVGKCGTDCSSYMTECAIAGGANIKYGSNAPTTSTMRKAFKDSGDYNVLTDKKYLNGSAYLKRGDILVKEGHHTVMVLSNGSKSGTSGSSVEVAKPTIKKGSSGEQVKILQKNLNKSVDAGLTVDGIAGEKTVAAIKKFQKKYHLTIDGIYGNKSYAKMKSVIK